MKKIILSGVALALSSNLLFAGGKLVEPVSAPVVAVSNHDTSGIYALGAVYYNNVYSTDYNWFNNGDITQDKVFGLTAGLGYNYNKYLAFESRISKSLLEEDYANEYHLSFFLKPQYRFRDDSNYEDDYVSIYGLLGFGYVHVEGTDGDTPGASEIIDKTIASNWNFQYGLGLSYTFVDTTHPENDSGDWSIFAEYVVYMNDASITPTRLYNHDSKTYDELSMNSLSIGISYQF